MGPTGAAFVQGTDCMSTNGAIRTKFINDDECEECDDDHDKHDDKIMIMMRVACAQV